MGTTVPGIDPDARVIALCAKPEHLYKKAADPAERQRLKAAVVKDYTPRVEAVARSILSDFPDHWPEATQAGIVGLLVALDRYDRCPPTACFWTHAWPRVRDEIRNWVSVGVFWRKDNNRGKSKERRAARAAAREQAFHVPFGAPESGRMSVGVDDPSPEESVSAISADRDERFEADSPEEQVALAELLFLVREHVTKLPLDDQNVILSEDPGLARSRHLKTLVANARAAFRKAGAK